MKTNKKIYSAFLIHTGHGVEQNKNYTELGTFKNFNLRVFNLKMSSNNPWVSNYYSLVSTFVFSVSEQSFCAQIVLYRYEKNN